MKSTFFSPFIITLALTWSAAPHAATIVTVPTNIGSSVLYPLTLSATGHLNEQTIDATLSNATLNRPVYQYGYADPFIPVPIKLSVVATAIDDKASGFMGLACVIGGDKLFGCSDAEGGDPELEFLQLISRGSPVQIDEPNDWYIADSTKAQAYGTVVIMTTLLGELPLSSLASLHISEKIKVTGDLNLYAAYLKVDYQDRDFVNPSPTPLPQSLWLFGSALVGILSITRRQSNMSKV
jgi:hypothetical protein